MSHGSGIFDGWLDRVHPDDQEHFARDLRAFLSSRDRQARFRYRLRRSGGEYVPVCERLVAERGADGTALRIVSMVEQWTPPEPPAHLLQYRELFQRTRDAVFRMDAEGRLRDFNPAFLELVGLNAPQLRGQAMSHFSRDPEALTILVDELARSGSVSDRELHLVTGEGAPRVVLLSAVASYDEQGRYSGHQAIARDVTDRKRGEDDPRQETARLEKGIGALRSLYAISERLTRAQGLGERLLADLLPLIPGGLRFPSRVRARIRIDGSSVRDPGFDEDTAWSTPLGHAGPEPGAEGSVAVSYLPDPSGGGELAPTDDERGFLREVAARLTETARRVHAEEARRQEETYHRTLVERSSDLLAIVDAGGVIRYASPAAERLLGYPAGSLAGKPALGLVHPEDRARVEAVLAAVAGEPSQARSVEHRVRHADGTWRYCESTGRDLLNDPDIGGILVNTRDVTDRRALEEELRHAQRMEVVGRLAAGVAHEFNNLLTVIRIGSELLEDHFRDGSRPDELDDIGNAAADAAVLTRRLLAFSGKEILKPQPLDLTQLLLGLEPFLQRVSGDAVQLRIDVPDRPLLVLADSQQVEQLVLDLFDNALDAMPRGGRVTVEAKTAGAGEIPPQMRRPGEWALVRVTDTGVGVPATIRDNIFEPFFTTKESGTGLGLATVRRVVTRLGGFVEIESEAGEGATFTVCLPRFRELSSPETDASEPPVRSEETVGSDEVAPAHPETVPRHTVLVVDVDPATRTLVERLLSAPDFRVLVAEDGVTALTLLDAYGGPLDLLVTALEMPQIRGEALAARVATTHPDVAVLYLAETETDGAPRPMVHRDALVHRLLPVVGELLEGLPAGGRGD